MIRLDRRYSVWGLAFLLLVLLPCVAGHVGLGWEVAQLLGWAAALACLALCGLPVRPRDAVPPTLLSLRRHTFIGWAALIAASLHAVGLVLVDHTVIEYLKPTAPPYQWMGMSALILLLAVVISSLPTVRHRLWANHRGFQSIHVISGCVLAALVTAHVIVTNRYVTGLGRRAWFLLVAVGALLMLLRFRRRSAAVAAAPRTLTRWVFGRHSRRVLAGVLMSAAAIAALSASPLVTALRQPMIARATPLPLDFPHGKHVTVNCLVCHHNYADGSGGGSCIECHRSHRADLKLGAEARFHAFCFECHRHPPASFEHHGPVSGCSVCHKVPDVDR
jgi:predicted CXXCH cytochrome family protein